jgi:transcriptional regulator NrdR family protein
MDKIYDTILRIYTGYTEREKLEKRGTEILQALNYYNYNKHKPTENMEVLEKRVIEVRNQIELYIKKIAHALIIETSNEEISEDVGKALKEFLSGAEDAAFSPLTESYLNRNKGLFIDLIRKSYIMKGLFVHLITEDKIPSTQ